MAEMCPGAAQTVLGTLATGLCPMGTLLHTGDCGKQSLLRCAASVLICMVDAFNVPPSEVQCRCFAEIHAMHRLASLVDF